MTLKVALFDLDNTLYPASSGLMQMVDVRINAFVRERLQITEEEAVALRRSYFLNYGTTLRGLQTHHTVDAEEYLRYVHDIALESYLASDAELDHLLEELPLRKAIFTNSPREYAERVLSIIGLDRHFETIFDIRSLNFYAKPDIRAYEHVLQILGAAGPECVFLEDTLNNLQPARRLGMRTILIDALAAAGKPGAVPEHADYVAPDVLAAMRIAMQLVAEHQKPSRSEQLERDG